MADLRVFYINLEAKLKSVPLNTPIREKSFVIGLMYGDQQQIFNVEDVCISEEWDYSIFKDNFTEKELYLMHSTKKGYPKVDVLAHIYLEDYDFWEEGREIKP